MIIKTIDAHVAGEPLRLVVDGFPAPRGRTMLAKREWAAGHADALRRALVLEPRGHADMTGAVLTEPVSPGAHAGVLFFHNDGFSTMSGHAVLAVTTIALECGLLLPGGDGATIVYDTPAGSIRARATIKAGGAGGAGEAGEAGGAGEAGRAGAAGSIRVERVSFVNVPSFVLHAGLPIQLGARHLRADVAYGGAFYAIVDSEAVGVAIDAAHLPELRRAGMAIKRAIESTHAVVHPLDPSVTGIDGTIFTGPSHDNGADLRNVAVFADAEVDRSPCGTGTCAVMAVVDAMGLLAEDKPFVHESVIGTRLAGRLVGRTVVGDYPAIVAEIEGSAWITGEHTFLVDDDDPLKDGFRL
jgi:proline racemase